MPELKFKAKISKSGENRIIWIPAALHPQLKDFLDKKVIVTISVEK